MRILVVEDETKLANAVRRALQLQKYAVDIAYDGQSGLDLAVGESFDLIILDVMLPGIDGMEICRRIRREGIKTPVLMLTAKGRISDKITGLDTGADDYMVKPFSFEELFARIRALFRRSVQSPDPLLQVKDLTLDPVSFKVERSGKSIKLSSREFSILEYLIRRKNTVVTRDQILSHVWDYDSDVLPGTVEVHIKHLRDKLDTSFTVPLIKTIRGFGYEITG
ncbi:DNA-binding response regulator [Candidatus Amesbacteria bacterium RIFCSPHIGHO2_01_FULL_47_34]|uniref:DNA-binding response regulator n=1 Tax=Candidatus Amesbacteria bacterium RIFCSPLOWO2_01_FULL_47_33 TaxID=1797258 RepID=A0A1F4Z0X7_9BACT|nr:MAG: DNA-binding response regulator [Candidatus Amesbacteria bacterium RIFCSPHIGHO2_01_FULL_47_34]OGC99901.1 MAG: DNA-binding response regulator [Candidatus Amesbacteria bacterium RIFCSPLOWO2_01_FULL_47_33]